MIHTGIRYVGWRVGGLLFLSNGLYNGAAPSPCNSGQTLEVLKDVQTDWTSENLEIYVQFLSRCYQCASLISVLNFKLVM